MISYHTGMRRFSSMLDIDKLIPINIPLLMPLSFSSMLDIDKLIHGRATKKQTFGFSSMLDIDKLIPVLFQLPAS